jgi:simple sugar transport system permease protein
MSAMTRVPPEIADTIIATIIYFAATSVLVDRNLDKLIKWIGIRFPRGKVSTQVGGEQ